METQISPFCDPFAGQEPQNAGLSSKMLQTVGNYAHTFNWLAVQILLSTILSNYL